MKLFKPTAILLVLLLAAMVMAPMVSAAPDKANHDGADRDKPNHYDWADKDKPNHDDRDDDKNCPADNGNGHAYGAKEHNWKCYHPVSFKNTTLAATDIVSKISGTSGDFAAWNGATVVLDTTYYDMTGTNASYSYDVFANGQYAGYVMVSASRDNYPILELSTGVTPDKDAATVLRAKQLAQTQITNRREVLGDGQPVYLGATFFYMAYPIEMNNSRSRPQQISPNWILVDLTEHRIVNQRHAPNSTFGFNTTQLKQLDAIQKQKIVEANAEWDSIGSASAAPMTAAFAAVPALQSSANTFATKNEIIDVPFYLWKWGCSPTSAAMILGYWRDKGLTHLPSDTIPSTWGDPLNYQLAGDMLTQYDPSGFCSIMPSPPCGGTLPILIAPGINTEFNQHGIETWTARNTFFDTYDYFVNEIDSGYPLVLTMYPGGSSTDRTTDYGYHSVAVVGYDKSGQLLTLHDTWNDPGTHSIVYGNWYAEQGTTVNPDIIHTITGSAGSNGAINPLGSISVPDGIRKTFTVTPDSGYVIDTILVDGKSTTENPYTFNDVTSDHTITATFQPVVSSSTGWNWATQGWGDWQHTATWSGGSGSEYGPVMVNDAGGNHGEHGADVSLYAGSTQSSVWKTFSDPSGTGWNTIEFDGLMTGSDVPGGRWMTLDINGQQVFGGTASTNPPGNGVPFTVKKAFPLSPTVTVRISNGQSPAWGPRFAMSFYSVKLSHENALMAKAGNSDTPFVIPDGSEYKGNVTATGTPAEVTVNATVTTQNP